MRLTLFFTFGVSLQDWANSGLIQRETRIYQELMNSHDISFTFMTYGDTEDYKYRHLLGDIQIVPIFEHIPRPKSKLLLLGITLLIPWVYRKVLQESDILKTNQQWGSWIAVLSSWIWKKPLLVRCGYELLKNSYYEGSGLRQWLIKLISRIAYSQAKAISLTTDEIAQFVKNTFSIPSDKITVIPNWIDTTLFSPTVAATNLHNRILFVGRLSPEKNIALLVKALSTTGLGLDIVGQGPEKQSISDYAKSFGVDLIFHPPLENHKMPEMYRQYPIFVLCSHYEGNPKVLLEAMACCCAAIGTTSSGIREVINHQETGLLVSNNVTALRNAILFLMHNPEVRVRLGRGARQAIIKSNSLKKSIKAEWAIYENILA